MSLPKRPRKHMAESNARTSGRDQEIDGLGAKKPRSGVVMQDMVALAKKTLLSTRKVAILWADQQISGGYALLTKAISSSKRVDAPTGRAFLGYISSAYEAAGKSGKKVIGGTSLFVNAILASDFSRNMESWLGEMFNQGIPSTYDAAVDAVYNATNVGGGHLHRLLDGSHTVWGMWDKVREASPEDTLLTEVVGYATALGKDLSSSVGIPLFDWSKPSYDEVASALSTTFGISRSWFADLLHVNATELIGTTVAGIGIALNWNKSDVREFSSFAGSMGISSIASANPALAVVALAVLAKSFTDAKHKESYSEFVNGLAKGGIGTGAFLATASAIGGPIWVGILAGMCVGIVVHKSMDAANTSEIASFVEVSLRNAIARFHVGQENLTAFVTLHSKE